MKTRFKVWHGRRGLRCWFDSLADALALAESIRQATGIFYAITAERGRK